MALCCARGIGARVACFFPSIAVHCLRYGGSRVLDTPTPRGRTRIVNDRICNWQNRNAKDCKFCGDLVCFVLGAVAERVGVRGAIIARGRERCRCVVSRNSVRDDAGAACWREQALLHSSLADVSSFSSYEPSRLYKVFRLTPSALAARRLSPPQNFSVPRMICICASASGVPTQTLIASPCVMAFFARDVSRGCSISTVFSARKNAR